MRAVSKHRRIGSRQTVDWSVTEFHNRRWRLSVALQELDRLRAGVIVVDSVGQVVEMNRAAKSIVRLGDGLHVRHGRLYVRRAFETDKLAKLIAAATADAESGPAAGGMLVGRRYEVLPYVLTVAPLRGDMAVEEFRFAMIVVVGPERHSPSERDLGEFFGLSPTEARLAAALLRGARLGDIATKYGVQITTVRTQLSSILRKVGAERQTDLIRILVSTGIGSMSLLADWLGVALAGSEMPL
jgi:DNA-binding CsgD family transcriptional regulator